ncbi:MAG: type IV pilin protein [Gammaproteobacteria bacterium]|nr:type IV pilin protein [Gammaproteobacteria bacterium]
MNRQTGFTLTELMITVAILIILAAIAVPNYRGHVLRSQRSDAMAALLRVAAAQEKFYLQNNTYTNDLGASGLDLGTASGDGHFTLQINNADLQGFDAAATATGGQTADKKCAFFSLDEQGTKFARDDDENNTTDICWR